MVPFPSDCECCTKEDHGIYGCGFVGLEGKATIAYKFGAKSPPWNKTCPRYCMADPHVQQIMESVEDYKRGALGNIRQLPSGYVDLLRAAVSELALWEFENERQTRT